jgi:RimJ/RimL family protein N-acetyltransferase
MPCLTARLKLIVCCCDAGETMMWSHLPQSVPIPKSCVTPVREPFVSIEQTRASIIAFERDWEKKRYGIFALEILESGQLIGFAGLSEPNFLPEIMPAVEIGWRLSRAAWRKGYATEAARAALNFGFTILGLPEIVSIYQVANEASGRIVQKLGMKFDRETIDPSCGRRVRVFRTSGK